MGLPRPPPAPGHPDRQHRHQPWTSESVQINRFAYAISLQPIDLCAQDSAIVEGRIQHRQNLLWFVPGIGPRFSPHGPGGSRYFCAWWRINPADCAFVVKGDGEGVLRSVPHS